MKIIKIKTDHYIQVDDSDIKEGDWCYDIALGIFQASHNCNAYNTDLCKKITHSTHPMQGVFPILITEVKELIGEVDVEKKAHNWFMTEKFMSSHIADMKSFIAGYNQALEDNKNKKYTEEDMRKIFIHGKQLGLTVAGAIRNGGDKPNQDEWFNESIESLQPKTEWEVEFDENGKLKLV